MAQKRNRKSRAKKTKPNPRLDKAVLRIKKESKSEDEARAKIKKLVAQDRLLTGNRPEARLVSTISSGGIRVGRIEVLLPRGFNASDLPPHGGDPPDGDIGGTSGPPYDTNYQDPENTDGFRRNVVSERDVMTAFDLERLLYPLDPQGFRNTYWEKQPLRLERNDADYYAALFSLKEFDRLLSQSRIRQGDIRILSTG